VRFDQATREAAAKATREAAAKAAREAAAKAAREAAAKAAREAAARKDQVACKPFPPILVSIEKREAKERTRTPVRGSDAAEAATKSEAKSGGNGCSERDLNSHGFTHRLLRPACLPIPPSERDVFT
jgi:hypothetical protein